MASPGEVRATPFSDPVRAFPRSRRLQFSSKRSLFFLLQMCFLRVPTKCNRERQTRKKNLIGIERLTDTSRMRQELDYDDDDDEYESENGSEGALAWSRVSWCRHFIFGRCFPFASFSSQKRGLAAKAFCALFLDEQKSNVFNPSLSLSLSLSLPRQKI